MSEVVLQVYKGWWKDLYGYVLVVLEGFWVFCELNGLDVSGFLFSGELGDWMWFSDCLRRVLVTSGDLRCVCVLRGPVSIWIGFSFKDVKYISLGSSDYIFEEKLLDYDKRGKVYLKKFCGCLKRLYLSLRFWCCLRMFFRITEHVLREDLSLRFWHLEQICDVWPSSKCVRCLGSWCQKSDFGRT